MTTTQESPPVQEHPDNKTGRRGVLLGLLGLGALGIATATKPWRFFIGQAPESIVEGSKHRHIENTIRRNPDLQRVLAEFMDLPSLPDGTTQLADKPLHETSTNYHIEGRNGRMLIISSLPVSVNRPGNSKDWEQYLDSPEAGDSLRKYWGRPINVRPGASLYVVHEHPAFKQNSFVKGFTHIDSGEERAFEIALFGDLTLAQSTFEQKVERWSAVTGALIDAGALSTPK